eukprot:SAG31_NODE_59_length_29571_cov_20.443506_36_plen_54_part_01
MHLLKMGCTSCPPTGLGGGTKFSGGGGGGGGGGEIQDGKIYAANSWPPVATPPR